MQKKLCLFYFTIIHVQKNFLILQKNNVINEILITKFSFNFVLQTSVYHFNLTFFLLDTIAPFTLIKLASTS